MRCFGQYDNSRYCDLCGMSSPKTRSDCVAETSRAAEERQMLFTIARKCPYRCQSYADHSVYEGCTRKPKDGWGDDAHCTPAETCLPYDKEETNEENTPA